MRRKAMANAWTVHATRWPRQCARRFRSTESARQSNSEKTSTSLWRRLARVGVAFGVGTGIGFTVSDQPWVRHVLFEASSATVPLIRLLDGETAHLLAVWAAKHRLLPKEMRPDPECLRTVLWGREFSNPIGLAAGFDKNGEAIDGLLDLGFGHVEVGSVTPKPQPGNPKPRVFRLVDQRAVINRYGFNSEGVEEVHGRLARRLSQRTNELGLVGINLGKNKTSEDAAADYVTGIKRLARFADYLVVNISSPNTPGLRALQGRKQLETLLKQVLHARNAMTWGIRGPPPLLIKIAPDLSEEDLEDVAAVATRLRVDGLIVSNTTVARPPEISSAKHGEETGGLSGKPLMESSTNVLHRMYELTNGRIPLVGCGGVSSGEDAYAKICAGASLVQLYTSFAFDGPALVPRIKRELVECLRRDGWSSVSEAVGSAHRTTA
uniref:Dihydroorotate dehydrogenase (quinone), mitochondrial n=1 Tax=Picocystis salinarum TaxID=88271 RepID=A0A7S3UDY9_9CHLO|mmetsp:Transcript_11444/g.70302  ORF Transcript_11444/g.70302 Transcript_11444/m.70302 type:complete len:437 (-) Transcript_11444:609-1919(-)